MVSRLLWPTRLAGERCIEQTGVCGSSCCCRRVVATLRARTPRMTSASIQVPPLQTARRSLRPSQGAATDSSQQPLGVPGSIVSLPNEPGG